MKKILRWVLMCAAFAALFTLCVSAQGDKSILLNAPVIDYTTDKITISGSLEDYTYSMWDNSRITLYVVKNGVEPGRILLDDSVLFNIAELSPEKDGTFSYTFEHNFKESFDRCTVYVNRQGYTPKQASYSISNADYNAILSDRVLIAVNSPIYYSDGVKHEAENVPYYDGDEVYVPNVMLSLSADGFTPLSEINTASLDAESGIISVGGAISNEQAMAVQSLFGLHVSADGNDTHSGANSSPVKTVSRALELCRLGYANEIFVHNGIYEDVLLIDDTLSDITIKGIGEVTVRAPSVKIAQSEFKLVQDEAVLNALPHTARGKVLYADFPDCDIKLPAIVGNGTLKQNESYYKVYQNDTELTNARFPNGGGFATADGTFGMTDDYSSEIIYYNDAEKLSRWNNAKDARVLIFRKCGYNMTDTDLLGTDTENNSVILDNPTKRANHQVIGDRFIIYNLIEELDVAGEWYIDRKNEKIYVFPFDGFDGIEIVKESDSIVKIDGADNVRIENINFERTRGTGIEIANADNVNIKNCDVHSAGRYGIFAKDVTDTVIDGCEVSDISKGGIYLNWDAYHDPDLKAQNNIIKNCEVHNIGTENSIAGAVYIGGTGNKVSHNTVYDTPHMAIWFDGNDNTVEYNEIFNALKYCDDAGIIYTNAGPYGFGNIVQYNYIHDCPTLNPNPTELYVIYLDYITNGITVKNNIIDLGDDNVYHGFGLFGGGRNNVLDSNVFIGNGSFLLSNRYQSGSMHDALVESAVLPNFIDSLTDSQKELWFKYPGIEEEYNYYKNSENGKVGWPRDCEITNNIFCAERYGAMSAADAEYNAFFKKKFSLAFASTKENGTFSGNTYVTATNTNNLPAMSSGCDDISIDGETLNILYPQNGAALESGKHRLVWKKVSGAQNYNVKICRKSDASTPIFELDTSESYADVELGAGAYVITLTAQNGSEEAAATAEFECDDVVFYSTSGELESVACDTVIYVSVPVTEADIVPELLDADGNTVESTVTSAALSNRRIIKITPQTLLVPEKTYTLMISNDATDLKTNKLCTAKAEFKNEEGSILASVKLNSLLERTNFDVDVYVSGKTDDGALGSVKIIPVTLTPQKSEDISESIDADLNAEIYVWKKSSSLYPVTIKMCVND